MEEKKSRSPKKTSELARVRPRVRKPDIEIAGPNLVDKEWGRELNLVSGLVRGRGLFLELPFSNSGENVGICRQLLASTQHASARRRTRVQERHRQRVRQGEMRHSGSPTPPLSTRSGASSPPPPPSQQQPPPQQQPRRLGSPAHSASAGTASERDPFLAQTAGIPLTEQDRQEGYDVELLNARPRGRYSTDLAAGVGTGHDTDDDSLSGREKYTGVASHHGTGLAPGIGAGAPLAAGAAAGAGGGIALGPIGSGPQYAYGGIDGAAAPVAAYNKEYPGGGGGAGGGGGGGEFSGGNSGTTAVSGRRKPWFLRPLPLLLVIGVIIGIALAVGLGVGLSQHHSGKTNNLGASSGSSGDRNSTSSRTSRSRSIGSTGTVVPSSLYSSYTSEHPQSTTTLSAIVVESAITTANGTITTATFVTSVPVPANGTTLATTGNRPVPAASSTTINGTVLSALTSVFAAETARIRRR